MDVASILNLLLLAFGCGFVIFWHELWHFLAAKWAGVRVEQFAVGFGNAIFSYRQGLGIRRGTSGPEYKQRIAEKPDLDISPTEYRLNWLPLGGYVKMLGQEDLAVPDGGHEPDSYQSKSVGQRMVIISAGVVANLVSAAALFVLVFTLGLETPAAVVLLDGGGLGHGVRSGGLTAASGGPWDDPPAVCRQRESATRYGAAPHAAIER